ncbi:uncharacterized protein LOC132648568 isoform X2 [Meriones unguiculatus]|uniref:uncharacterized protein LOC132648568 isoform X2 n=1 Tax=Meriones unguiculatus TaxID=10047 RepID=UPI00293E1F71|nr:uncharacterized protein LOC132648568 isoform X2 [Meriones unguiculatus]
MAHKQKPPASRDLSLGKGLSGTLSSTALGDGSLGEQLSCQGWGPEEGPGARARAAQKWLLCPVLAQLTGTATKAGVLDKSGRSQPPYCGNPAGAALLFSRCLESPSSALAGRASRGSVAEAQLQHDRGESQ